MDSWSDIIHSLFWFWGFGFWFLPACSFDLEFVVLFHLMSSLSVFLFAQS